MHYNRFTERETTLTIKSYPQKWFIHFSESSPSCAQQHSLGSEKENTRASPHLHSRSSRTHVLFNGRVILGCGRRKILFEPPSCLTVTIQSPEAREIC